MPTPSVAEILAQPMRAPEPAPSLNWEQIFNPLSFSAPRIPQIGAGQTMPPYIEAKPDETGLIPRREPNVRGWDGPPLASDAYKINPQAWNAWLQSQVPSLNIEDRRNEYVSPTGNRYFQFRK